MEATEGDPDGLRRLWTLTVAKKMAMAVTGVILFGFVVVHLFGNLQVYLGQEAVDAYALLLRGRPSLLWFVRIILFLALVVHVVAAWQLGRLKRLARPVSYRRHATVAASLASRTMGWTGVAILVFVTYHVLHFTFGVTHPQFRHLAIYQNLVVAFQVLPVSIIYVIAMVVLGAHMAHGLWSMLQSVGLFDPRLTRPLRRVAWVVSALLVIGFASIPLAILAGLIG
jgi:succinate dehydrogenase / fumarate reductase, cytochrome b subunit